MTLLLIIATPLTAREFLNTILHINIGAQLALPYGSMIDHEYDSFSMVQTYSDGSTENIRPSHFDTAFGLTIDLVPLPPIMLFDESQAIKIGLRGLYRVHYLKQNITITDSDDKERDYGGDLLQFQSWMVGPVIHYSPRVEFGGLRGNFTSNGGLTAFVLMGQIMDGTLESFPSKRAAGNSVSNYQTDFSGLKIDAGVGGEVGVCSVNLGLNIFYSVMFLNLDDDVYNEEVSTNPRINEIAFEIYMGIPVEWFTEPRVYNYFY